MKKSEIRLKNTLAVIRLYKLHISGNYWDLMDAVNRDAVRAVGQNPAFMFIGDRKAGCEWSADEKAAFNFSYHTAIKDASEIILSRVHKAIPAAIRECRLFRQYITNKAN